MGMIAGQPSRYPGKYQERIWAITYALDSLDAEKAVLVQRGDGNNKRECYSGCLRMPIERGGLGRTGEDRPDGGPERGDSRQMARWGDDHYPRIREYEYEYEYCTSTRIQ